MTTKRSCIVRSSSVGETGLFDQIPFLEKKRPAPLSIPKPAQEMAYNVGAVRLEPHQRPAFTIGSPISYSNIDRSEGVDERFGVFSQACNLCKKAFNKKDDLYMYSYLRAFCSKECRDEQLYHDEKNNKLPDTPTVSEVYLHLMGIAFEIQGKNKLELQKKEVESRDFVTQAKRKPIIRTSFKYV